MGKTKKGNIGIALLLVILLVPLLATAVELLPPTISVAPIEYYPLDEVFYIEGKAAPNTRLELFFERTGGGAAPIRVLKEVNANGEWFYSEKLELASGEWMVRARSIGNKETYSDWSNPRVFRSVVSGFIWGSLKIRYLPILLVIATLLALAISFFIWSVYKLRSIRSVEFREALRKKDRELIEREVETEFAALRRELREELSHLEAKDKKLSRAEEAHRERLLRELERAEETIEKKVKSIT